MEIVGLGTQVMECARVRMLIDQHGETFLRQVFTDRELSFCNSKKQTTEQFTALWAAKEAVFRSLGTTWRRGTNWTDVEIVCDTVESAVVVSGPTSELKASRGITQILIAMARCRAFATATAIAVRELATRPVEDTALDD
jgi:holo-[acyl-carrier protein] synthase